MISVIIPVFNAEKYLAKTLENIRCQTYRDLEIICVLDAPTDGSEKIAAAAAKKDRRVKLIRRPKNMGAAAARNLGAAAARGEYIHFMDADDLISADFYDKMIECGKGCDVIASSVFYEKKPKYSIWFKKSEIARGREKFEKSEVLIQGWAWRYLIRRAFWNRRRIKFPPLSVMEDMPAMIKVIYYADKVALCRDAVYFYKNREDSVLNKKHADPKLEAKRRLDWEAGRKMKHDLMRAHGIKGPNRLLYLIKRI
jgi:glycosyltransferase involved in cell wall biosynthesis